MTRNQQQDKLQKINSRRLNNTLMNDKWAIEEVKKETKKSLEFNKNLNMSCQNLWETEQAVLRGKKVHDSMFTIQNLE